MMLAVSSPGGWRALATVLLDAGGNQKGYSRLMGEDAELLERWRGGEQDAGRALFERYFESMFRFFRSKVPDAAEDLTQQVFLRCVKAKTQYQGRSSFRTYLFTIARNILYDHFRGCMRRGVAFVDGEVSVVDFGARSPSSWVQERDENRLLLRALRRLSVDMQVALELHYWEELTVVEIAEIVDAPVGTVKRRIQRARERLDQLIVEIGEDVALVKSTADDFPRWAAELRQNLAALSKA